MRLPEILPYMFKKPYLILISALALSAVLKADEVVLQETEVGMPAPESEIAIEDKMTEALAEADEVVDVSESELVEMVGYLTAQGGRIPSLELDDSAIGLLAQGLLKGLNGEIDMEDISQESIEDAFDQARLRAEALEEEAEELPEISESALQTIGVVMLEQSGLAYLGFGAEDADLIINGFITGSRTDEPDAAMQAKLPAFQEFMQKRVAVAQEKMAAEAEAAAAENIAAGEAFLEELVAADADVQKSESGLRYKILDPGADEKPTLEDSVLVHYKGTLIDGTQFDSSYDRGKPAEFPLNGVVSGFGEGLTKIGAGGKIILYLPSDLAYGNTPRPGGPIKPGDTLIFECELIEVNPE